MKSIVFLISLVVLLGSCNPNPSKEARIQKLEAENELHSARIDTLENIVERMDALNKQLELRIQAIE